MFAILISKDNLEKVLQTNGLTEFDRNMIPVYYLDRRVNWYMVRGYVTRFGNVMDWSILPEYTIKENFEHDPVKIQTDWDQIVRK